MPYEKIPITHKFGIISQSHKKQLQERLIQRRRLLESEAQRNKKHEEIINLQITEDFVKGYNEANVEKKIRLDQQCVQMFEKIKKKLYSSHTDDLNIQLAWAELSQLCQCSSPIQEECMDLFIFSMEYARISATQIPTLFFLAETVIYWIRTDIINQPFLRAFELKLLKVGQLIFQRIYFHLLEGTLSTQDDLKEHLSIYLQGFEELKNAYSPYPDALLYMSFMISIGSSVIQSKIVNNTLSNASETITDENKSLLVETKEPESNSNETKPKKYLEYPIFKLSIQLYNYLLKKKISSSHEDILDFYLSMILDNTSGLNNKDWIDTGIAFYILGECAKINIKALDTFLSLSGGTNSQFDTNINNNSLSDRSFYAPRKNEIDTWNSELACLFVDVLADICINSSQAIIKKKALYGFHKEAREAVKYKFIKPHLLGYGILDTAKFQIKVDENEEDWSWKVRYASIKALVRICKSLQSKDWEELRQTCWSCLVIFQETETNAYVLEALKVGQINSKIKDHILEKKSTPNHSLIKITEEEKNIFCQIAISLFQTSVNELDDKNRSFELKQKKKSNELQNSNEDTKSIKFENVRYGTIYSSKNPTTFSSAINSNKEINIAKKRTTLKEEIIIHNQFKINVPTYFDRKNFDLMRIVEDQYRKDEKEKFERQMEDNNR